MSGRTMVRCRVGIDYFSFFLDGVAVFFARTRVERAFLRERADLARHVLFLRTRRGPGPPPTPNAIGRGPAGATRASRCLSTARVLVSGPSGPAHLGRGFALPLVGNEG